jgi:hypothetical protein
MLKAKLIINPKVTKLLEKLPIDLLENALPKAYNAVTPYIKREMRGYIVRYANSDITGSRERQSASAKKRFPTRMKDNIGYRTIKDTSGVLRVIGVTNKAAHVNFDHGDKARGKGREHKLWFREGHKYWHAGGGKASSSPAYRKQVRDIASMVADSSAVRVQKEVRKAVIKQIRESSR